ncbi:GIY-YIG nuclease family protein [Fluviicola taffensis]|uniref:GIY-YIG nuclease family protein n=1 Tax=Fluviicola taffensis TaxID=191579 RepID=UPI00313778BE
MKHYSVYVIQSEFNGSFYVGMALDVQERLKEHNAGKSTYTKSFIPWKLIYSEEVGEAPLARQREKYLKSTAGKNFLRKQGIID